MDPFILAIPRRYVTNDTLFDELVKSATLVTGHRWVLGGNAPAMARRFAIEGLDVMLGARVAAPVLDALPKSVKGRNLLGFFWILKLS